MNMARTYLGSPLYMGYLLLGVGGVFLFLGRRDYILGVPSKGLAILWAMGAGLWLSAFTGFSMKGASKTRGASDEVNFSMQPKRLH